MELKDAVQGVRAMAQQAQALATVVAALDEVGDITAHLAEKQRLIEAAQTQLAGAQAAVMLAHSQREQINAEGVRAREDAEADAKAVKEATAHECDEIIATARDDAERLLEHARRQANNIAAAIGEAQTKLEALTGQINVKQSVFDELSGQLEALRAKLGG